MYTEWLAVEHYRVHLIEEWPDGAQKEASLAAARAALAALEQSAPLEASAFSCEICSARNQNPLRLAA